MIIEFFCTLYILRCASNQSHGLIFYDNYYYYFFLYRDEKALNTRCRSLPGVSDTRFDCSCVISRRSPVMNYHDLLTMVLYYYAKHRKSYIHRHSIVSLIRWSYVADQLFLSTGKDMTCN